MDYALSHHWETKQAHTCLLSQVLAKILFGSLNHITYLEFLQKNEYILNKML